MAKRKMIPTPANNIAKQIMETYQPQHAQEIQDVVKHIFAPIFEAALKGKRQNHLGYAAHEHTESGGSTCNGYSEKTLKVPEGLGGPFRGCCRMAEQLHACRATVFLRQRRAQGHVYDERHRERERQLSQGHEEGGRTRRLCSSCCIYGCRSFTRNGRGAGYQTGRSFATNC